MRKFFRHTLFIVLVFTVLFSCKKDEEYEFDPYPNVSFFPSDSSRAFEGDTIRFDFNVTAPTELRKLEIFKKIGAGPENPIDTIQLDGNTLHYPYTYIVEELTAGSLVFFRFKVTDKEGETSSVTYTIRLLGLNNFTAVQFDYPIDSMAASFYSSSDEQVYSFDSANTNQPAIDWMYHYDNSANRFAGMYAISDTMPDYQFQAIDFWIFRNQTLFKNSGISSGQFDAMTASDVSLVVNDAATATSESVDSLVVNDVVVFKITDDRSGAFKVTNLQPGTGAGDFIEIDIWIQEEN